MNSSDLPPLRSTHDLERVLEFEFVRATENAALQAIHWLGRGEKEKGGLQKKFKLDGSIATTNMMMFDMNSIIRKFER